MGILYSCVATVFGSNGLRKYISGFRPLDMSILTVNVLRGKGQFLFNKKKKHTIFTIFLKI